MEFLRGRYSWLLRPFLITIDITIVNVFSYVLLNLNENQLYFFSNDYLNNKFVLYGFYSIVFWIITAQLTKFYRVYRFTSLVDIFSLLIKQFLFYTIIVLAFIGIFRSINIQFFILARYIFFCFLSVGLVKILSFYLLKGYRSYFKGNFRRVVLIGRGAGINELKKIFTIKKELGYKIQAVFSNDENGHTDGTIKDGYAYLTNNTLIDEIYCGIDAMTEKQINAFVKLAELNHINIKFVPNKLELATKRLSTDYYNYLPVLSIQEPRINNDLNKLLKRVFDFIFSFVVILFVLPWVSAILFVLLKLESKGPLFYVHKRNGINYKEFTCYKFRSLKTTKEVKGTYVKKEDVRLTKIGKFLRKTSLDELPQFLNVLKGDMSVVGPRPHMLSYTDDYAKIIDKYNFIFRHNVKPGITGLAQIKGYRGEIQEDKDIVYRIKYDIFYIENWSIFLDIKIIAQTIFNIFTGDMKAY
ncbi:undecaprenyl-phosphate glucose phosphotransferase [Flavobacteriaceae bacterium MHTCC 0001]